MAFAITAYSEAPFSAEPSNVIVYPLGIQLTAQEDSVSTPGDANVSVTGIGLTGTLGSAIGSAFVAVNPTGQSLSSTLGTVTTPIGQQVDVTGFELTANADNLTQDTLTAFGQAPFATLSPSTFNIPVEVEATVGGIAGTFPLPMSLGSLSVTANADVSVTGQAMTMQEGDAEADDASAEVTGIGFSATLASVTATPNTIATPSGQEMTMQEGDAAADDASAEVTGIGFSATLASVTATPNTIATPSGQEMTMQEGQADATDASAELTGIGMTIATGNTKNIMWSEVNTGTAPTWTEVDTAA
jgi:hypothetical protein